jgi:hypothetical protein
VQVRVCTLSGLLPTPACPETHLAWFLEGTAPTQADDVYRRVTVNTPDGPQTILALNLPPRAWEWARAHGWPLVQDLQDFAASSPATTGETDAAVRLLSPADGSAYRLAPDLPPEAQEIRVAAETALPQARLRLWADGSLLAECPGPECTAWWPLSPGQHQFWAEAIGPAHETQRSATVHIQVDASP